MKSFTFRLCVILINAKRTEGLQDKVDVFFANGRLTAEEYTEISGMIPTAVA